MPKESLRVDLLGTSFTIKADEDPAYLRNLLIKYARIVDETRSSTGLIDPLKISIVAGLVLCDELDKARRGTARPDSDETERIALDLIARIDDALKE
jgi:cell division protein ZapA (FtsZ GTPase activity inhibitor)